MDNNAKVKNQNDSVNLGSDQVQQVQINNSSLSSAQSSQPVVGSLRKESAPLGQAMPEIKPSGPEAGHELAQELREIGVKETQQRPDLTNDHREIGMNHAGDSVPAPTSYSNSTNLPMTEEEIEQRIKGSPNDSGTWLALISNKIMKALGLK
jgi:hypothetical protein